MFTGCDAYPGMEFRNFKMDMPIYLYNAGKKILTSIFLLLEYTPCILYVPGEETAAMSRNEIFKLIKEYFVKEFEVPEEKISEEALLFDDLELDSIDALDMVGMLESELNIEVDEEEIGSIRTVKDVIDFLEQKLPG